MILIISQSSDRSTDNVIDWLEYFNVKWDRLDGEQVLNYEDDLFFDVDSPILGIAGKTLDKESIKAIWYRRDSEPSLPELPEIKQSNYYPDVIKHLRKEVIEAKIGFYTFLEERKKTLGNFRRSSLNKINTLLLARKCGLTIPAMIISSSKKDIIEFKKKHGKIITKSISEVFNFKIDTGEMTGRFNSYTEEVADNVEKEISEHFFPSFFQEMIDKELEIRTFYLNEKCYSMAIFSQLDRQTEIDFRKYNRQINNRNVPYKLPDEEERKIIELMTLLSLNTGSLDIILSKSGKYVFLEVNPVGQYGMTSIPCNYYLDKKIANFLIEK